MAKDASVVNAWLTTAITFAVSLLVSGAVPWLCFRVNAVEVQGTTPDVVNSVTSLTEEKDNVTNEAMAQVTSVSQLSDVQPTDWAFVAR